MADFVSDALDQQTPLPRITIGFFLAVLAVVIAGTQFAQRMDDVAERQQKYIERRDQQHRETQAELEELHARYHDLCHELAARWQEPICE